jgi:hypothetical protein
VSRVTTYIASLPDKHANFEDMGSGRKTVKAVRWKPSWCQARGAADFQASHPQFAAIDQQNGDVDRKQCTPRSG